MEEPRKTVRARYLGSAEVPRATGMDVLNDALERLAAARAPPAWRAVSVAVAPSMITITEEGVGILFNKFTGFVTLKNVRIFWK